MGRRIVLRSPHPKDRVVEQIRHSVASPLSLQPYGVSGGVYFGRLRLAWGGLIANYAIPVRPVFKGRLVEAGHETELHATFSASLLLRVFFMWWYLFLAFTNGIILLVAVTEGVELRNGLIMLGVLVLFGSALPGMHYLFNRKADAHFDAILDQLARDVGLSPVTAE